jgi:hypothetical protein
MQCGHWLMLDYLQSSKERKEVKHAAKRSIQGKQEPRQNNLPSEAFATFRYFSILSAQGDKFLHQCLTNKGRIRA